MIYLYLLFYGLLLLYKASTLGIGAQEAQIVFSSPLFSWIHSLFKSELAVRVPNIAVTLVNIYLIYLLSKRYFKDEKEALFSAVLFSLFPAIIASGVVLNKATFIIFLTLVFIFLYQNRRLFSYIFAFFLLFLDNSFAILFLALFFYALYRRDYREGLFFLLCFLLNVALFGFDIGGKPRNYFLDTFAIFATIFSPLLFLYFFYTIYRILVKEQKDILWFISATAFLFSLFLSFRQKIELLDFAPFVVLGAPLMVRTFLNSYKVRIKKHRKKLKLMFFLVMGSLIVNDVLLVFNDFLFYVYGAKKHFAYRNYLASELSKFDCVETENKKLQLALKFYGVGGCDGGCKKREIFYKDIYLGSFCVSEGNKTEEPPR